MLNNKSILIVEDEPAIALDLSVAIKANGGRFAGVAATLADAMEKARTLEIDVAILDFNLPDGCTTQVAELLRSRGIPFVFYTGRSEADRLRIDWPGVEVISKPARAETVIRSLTQAA